MYQFPTGASGFLALLVLTMIKPAVSSVYPTNPVAATTFSTGQLATVRWRDDGHYPHLKDIGPMKIDLHTDSHGINNTYITTLATHVDPVMRSYTLFIPPDLPTNRRYYMRFICSKPSLTIYTADFRLTRGAFLPVNIKPEDASQSITNPAPTPMPNPNSNPGLAPQLEPVTTVHANPLDGGAGSKDSGGHGSKNGLKKSPGKKLDCSGRLFKMASVLWPAVVGFSLAI